MILTREQVEEAARCEEFILCRGCKLRDPETDECTVQFLDMALTAKHYMEQAKKGETDNGKV
jgi:hypothetical protein